MKREGSAISGIPATTAVSPEVVIRVAGLPATVLERLRASATTDVLDRLHVVEDALRDVAVPLSDELHAAIGSIADKSLRAQLITLRRDVFNKRRPRGGDLDVASVAGLAEETRRRLLAWHRLLEQRAELTRLACATCDLDAAVGVQVLRDVAQDPSFQQGLATASTDFTRDLLSWLDGPAERSADPHLLSTLYKYVTRAAAKTSPFSTFTGSAIRPWAGSGSVGPVPPGATGGVELNVFISSCIRDRLADIPEIRPWIPVRVTPGIVFGDRIVALVARYGAERLISIDPEPDLRIILCEIKDGGPRPYRQLVAELAERLDGDAGAVRAYLDRLIEIGLLEAIPPVPDQAADHIAALSSYLADLPVPAARRIVTALQTVQRCVDNVALAATGRARLTADDGLRGALADVYAALGWGPQPPAATARHLYFEDTRCGQAAPPSRERWEQVLDDLAVLRELCGLYDWSEPVRTAAADLFTGRVRAGATMGLLEFFRLAGGDAALQQAMGHPRTIPPTGRLADLQRRMRELLRSSRADADGIRRADPGDLWNLLGQATPMLRRPRSVAFFGQSALDPSGRPVFVLNSAETGHGRAMARVSRTQRMSAAGRPGHLASAPMRAVIPAAAGSNVNLWAGDEPAEIGYPGVVGTAADTITLADLRVARDPATGRLILLAEREGCLAEVVPVHRGQMAEFFLPPMHRFLIEVFGEGCPYYLRQGLTAFTTTPGDGGVRMAPRTAVGDVVVSRATMLTRSEALPAPVHGEHHALYLSRVTRWRQSLGLPDHVFLRAVSPDAGRTDATAKARKPLYLDLTNAIAVQILGSLAGAPGQMVFIEEAFPDPCGLSDGGGQPRVTELVFEIG